MNKKYKLQSLVALLAVITITVFSSGNVIAAPKSYPIVCYGGSPQMQLTLDRWNDDVFGFRLKFRKSQHAGSSGKLVPGECAWLDRPMNSKESNELWILGSKKGWELCNATIDSRDKKVSDVKFCFNDKRKPAQEMNNLYNQIISSPSRKLYFHGYSNVNGSISVTRIGP